MPNLRIAEIFLTVLAVAAATANGAPSDAPPKSGLPTVSLQKAGELAQKTMVGIRDDLDKQAKQFPVLEGVGKLSVTGVTVPASEDGEVHLHLDFEKNVNYVQRGPGTDGSIAQTPTYCVVEKGGVQLRIGLAQNPGKVGYTEQFWLAKVADAPRLSLYYCVEQNPPDPELTKSIAAIVRARAAQFTAMAAASAIPEKKEVGEPRVLTLAIPKGQYLFVGSYRGPTGGGEPGPVIRPEGQFHVSADAGSDGWDIQMTFEKAVTEDAEKVWKWKAVVRAKAPDGSMQQRGACAEKDIVRRFYKPVREVPIEIVDASKEKGIEGLSFYKIPYANVAGETRYVVVAMSNNVDLFAKAITVPEGMSNPVELFAQAPTVPEGPTGWNWKKGWLELK